MIWETLGHGTPTHNNMIFMVKSCFLLSQGLGTLGHVGTLGCVVLLILLTFLFWSKYA